MQMTQTIETYDERVKVETWRLHVLMEAGFPVPLAERVAHSNADLHQAVALRLDLRNGERVHVYGRPELFEPRGELRLRALAIERFGLGEHLAALERLKEKLAAEGLFAPERKRPLPRFPRRIGLVTGNDAAAKRDVIAGITARFPPARLLVAETYVQGPRAATAIVDALRVLAARPD